MKLRDTLTLSTAAIALLSAPAAHAEGTYVSLFGGISTFDDELLLGQSTSNSSTIPLNFFGQTTVRTGPQVGTYYKGTITPTSSIYQITFYISRTVGRSTTIGNVYKSTSNLQYSAFNWRDDFENGFVIGGAFGMNLGDGWRSELELAYRTADVDSDGRFRRANTGVLRQFSYVKSATRLNYRYAYTYSSILYTTTATYGVGVGYATGTKTISTGKTTGLGPLKGAYSTTPLSGTTTGNFTSNGQAETWSIMANVWYDYNLGNGVTAIVGGGIGAAHVDLEYNAAVPTYFGGTVRYGLDDSGWGFAYQLGVGLGYDLGGGMTLSAEYRYFGTTDVDVGATDIGIDSHNFIVGLRVPLGH